MTTTSSATAPAAARQPDPVECPSCGGDVLLEGRKVGPHNKYLFGRLPVTKASGAPVFGVYVSETEQCPGSGKRFTLPGAKQGAAS